MAKQPPGTDAQPSVWLRSDRSPTAVHRRRSSTSTSSRRGFAARAIPHHALTTVSVDANATLRVEIAAANELDWQFDARIVDGSLDTGRVFCEGDSVHEDDVAEWVERVAGVVGERLEGGH